MYPMKAVPLHQMAIHAPDVHVGTTHIGSVRGPMTHMAGAAPQVQADSHAFRMLLAQHLMNALQMKQGGAAEGRNPMNPTGVMP